MINATWCLRRYFRSSVRLSDKTFLDFLQLRVQAGAGGKGKPSLGGRGGDGGSVFFKGVRSRNFKQLQESYSDKIIKADDGKKAENARILGAPANDVVVKVPVGVSVTTPKGKLIGDINKQGDVVCIAKGGEGGGPENDYRAKIPKLRYVNLDLKLVADVGLVGFPNAGKSTLLTRLSNATPRVAEYPFTTLRPQLGVLMSDEEERRSLLGGLRPRRITVADLPGLVEGAHKNVGLGHEFLKHVERTKVFLLVVDVRGFYMGNKLLPFVRDPFQTVCLLLRELERYNAVLSRRPSLLCVNKVEHDADVDAFRRLVTQLNDFDAAVTRAFPDDDDEQSADLRSMRKPVFHGIHAISAKECINLRPVAQNLFKLLLPEPGEVCNADEEGEMEDYGMRRRNEGGG